MSRRLTVDLAGRPYAIELGAGLLPKAGELIRPLLPRPFTVIVTDETVDRLHGGALRAGLAAAGVEQRTIVLPPGEQTKSFAGLERLCGALLDAGADRKDMILALGGGVIGDLTGFAAAILKRGCRYAQLPTTLLAQVDSSVGGKTAIDTPQGKNLIGAFHQPSLVIADQDVLDTLPPRELRAGYAEVAKYGLLGDAGFFTWLEANGAAVLAHPGAQREEAIARSCAMKADIVARDERETGDVRALLNLGHTFGHALETAAGFDPGRLLHGEAVAIGMVMAFDLSVRLGLCPADDARRARAHLKAAGLPVRPGDVGLNTGPEQLLEHMAHDKKNEGGQLVLILVRGAGQAFVARGVDLDATKATLAAA